MKFSIIIPVYNKEAGISSTLSSVLSQSFHDYEIVIVDDGSTDSSLAIIRQFDDKRIKIIQQVNSGPSVARNNGVRHANGEWIFYIDADDELEPNALSLFASLSEQKTGINFIACNYYVECNGVRAKRSNLFTDGIVGNNFRAWFFSRLLPCQGSYILKREVALKHPFPTTLKRWEDASMLFDIFKEEQVLRNNTPVFTYHRDYSQASRKCKDPKLDFLCNLDPANKSFWERICLYRFFVQSTKLYPEESKKRYNDNFDNMYIKLSYNMIEGFSDLLISIKHKLLG